MPSSSRRWSGRAPALVRAGCTAWLRSLRNRAGGVGVTRRGCTSTREGRQAGCVAERGCYTNELSSQGRASTGRDPREHDESAVEGRRGCAREDDTWAPPKHMPNRSLTATYHVSSSSCQPNREQGRLHLLTKHRNETIPSHKIGIDPSHPSYLAILKPNTP